MTEEAIKNKAIILFEDHTNEKVIEINPLPTSGSYRKYFRIKGNKHILIAAWNENTDENNAFAGMAKHFLSYQLRVPLIHRISNDRTMYLLEDLGDTVLFDHLSEIRAKHGISGIYMDYYHRLLDDLVRFQVIAGQKLDYSICYPVPEFDAKAFLWDLNYFKYNFLKLLKVPFDEYQLEEDFGKLTSLLIEPGNKYFVYRDFQTRNVMVKDGEFFYIDFQGGRKGPLQYDVASLLFQARAELPEQLREELLDYYIQKVSGVTHVEKKVFKDHYYNFVLIRILQTLGAYGFRGLYEKKQHFMESISRALANIRWMITEGKINEDLTELKRCLDFLVSDHAIESVVAPPLQVSISSFSYKRGIPADLSGNGGGFVFDCRALPNPGRLSKYADLTGNNEEVIDFLSSYPEVETFIQAAFEMTSYSVRVYMGRHFTNLAISFGCTGGRHRSVYCAEQLAKKLCSIPGIKIVLHHCEQGIEKSV